MNDSDESSASSSSSHPLASVSNSSTVVSTSAFLTSPSSNSISHLPSSSGNKPTASVSPSESDNNRHHVQQQQQQPIVPLYKPCNKEKIRTFVFTSVTKSPRETLDSGSRGPVIEELSIKIPEVGRYNIIYVIFSIKLHINNHLYFHFRINVAI